MERIFDGDDDNELCLQNGGPKKGIKPCFQPRSPQEILTIASVRYAASRV